MSVLDQLRGLEKEVRQRLRELGPLVAEYREVKKVAERLGIKLEDEEAGGEAAADSSAAPSGKPRAKRAAKARAPKPAAARKPRAKAKAAAKRQAGGEKPAGKRAARKRAAVAPGQRQQDVLRLVRERPGITVAELAGELDVDATGLYGVVRRLQGRGEISKEGPRLLPADTPAGTDVTPAATATEADAAAAGARETAKQEPEPPAGES